MCSFLFGLSQTASLRHADSRVWESSLICIFLQPQHLPFIFPGNNLTNGAQRFEMISPSFFYLSRQLCQLEFKTLLPSGRSGSMQRGRNYLRDVKLWQQSDGISFAKSAACLITLKKYPWCDLTFYGLFHCQLPTPFSLSFAPDKPAVKQQWAFFHRNYFSNLSILFMDL